MDADPKLLEILVCPLTKGPLVYDRERQELISKKAGLAYPIRDGIPVMLPDEARPRHRPVHLDLSARAGTDAGREMAGLSGRTGRPGPHAGLTQVPPGIAKTERFHRIGCVLL